MLDFVIVKELPNNQGVLREDADFFGERQFREEACKCFPDLREQLLEEQGLLHVEMGLLTGAAYAAISAGDFPRVRALFGFLESVLAKRKLHRELKSAVEISFVELSVLRQSENGRQALQMLPPKLRAILIKT